MKREYPDMDLKTVFGGMISGSYDSISIGKLELLRENIELH